MPIKMAEDNLLIHKLFLGAAQLFPDKVALQIKKGEKWQSFTYRDAERESAKVGAYLINCGFKKGDFAAIILENRPEWPIIYLGIMRAGLSAVPLDPQLTVQEIKNLLGDCGARLIFCSQEIYSAKLEQLSREIPFQAVVIERGGLGEASIDSITWPEVSPEEVASLIYTSGTTALPKGVLLTHKNICSDLQGLEKLKIVLPTDNFLSILPLYHTYSFMATLVMPLSCGATVTYCTSLSSAGLVQTIREAKGTILVGVPQLFNLMLRGIQEKIRKIPTPFLPFIMPLIKIKLRRSFGALRLIISGGARLLPKTARGLSKLLGVKLLEGYGLTETSPVATINPPQKIKLGSVGPAIPGVRVRISNPDKDGIGEVLISGPNVMKGYFRHPELTAEVIKDGWFYSGDLGYLDKEEYLFLTARLKDVIVLSSGKNIYPEELEEHFSKSPYIKQICVLSRAKETGESLFAVVFPNLEYMRQINESDVAGKIRWELENLNSELPSYKHIMGFDLTKEELPCTALKKIKRYAVRQEYLGKEKPEGKKAREFTEEERGILVEDRAQEILRYFSQQFKREVFLDTHLEIDLGLDSLSRVELSLGLSRALKIDIPEKIILPAATIKEVILNIQALVLGKIDNLPQEKYKSWGDILRLPPPQEIIRKIRTEPSLFDIFLTFIIKNTLLLIFRIFGQLKIKNSGALPARGPFLICPNHASFLDGFAVSSSLPFSTALNTFFLGRQDIFELAAFKWAGKAARLIPVDVASDFIASLQAVAYVASRGKNACVFPEGKRSIDENVQEFKRGIGILIKELDIPAVPVYIKGSHRAWPRTRPWPRPAALTVVFGRPLSLTQLLQRKDGEAGLDDYEVISRRLREEVINLSEATTYGTK